MDCPYRMNSFCSTVMNDEVRETLCKACTIRSHAKGQMLTINYWSSRFTVLIDGLLVAGYQKPLDDKMFVTGIASSGAIVGNAKIFYDCPTEMTDRIVYFINKCVTASFDDHAFEIAMQNQQFRDSVLHRSFQVYWYEKEELLRAVGGTSSYDAVKFIVKYCTDRGIAIPTHEQIALMCNRARPTVTNILHELIKKEPEIFGMKQK